MCIRDRYSTDGQSGWKKAGEFTNAKDQTVNINVTDKIKGIRLVNKAMDYTDDCQMLEAAGYPVYLSRGDYDNIKITTPVDLVVATAMVDAAEGERI